MQSDSVSQPIDLHWCLCSCRHTEEVFFLQGCCKATQCKATCCNATCCPVLPVYLWVCIKTTSLAFFAMSPVPAGCCMHATISFCCILLTFCFPSALAQVNPYNVVYPPHPAVGFFVRQLHLYTEITADTWGWLVGPYPPFGSLCISMGTSPPCELCPYDLYSPPAPPHHLYSPFLVPFWPFFVSFHVEQIFERADDG